MNPGDNSAKSKFQEVQQAYDVLSDDQKEVSTINLVLALNKWEAETHLAEEALI